MKLSRILQVLICNFIFSNVFCEDECGLVYASANSQRIVGGEYAVPHSWPSAAYIRFNYKAVVVIQNSISKIVTFSSTCGGTLIDRRTVLTAAHCFPTKVYFEHQGNQYYANVQPNSFYPTFGSMYQVYLGLHDKSLIDSGANIYPAIQAQVSSIVRHENYNSDTNLNDVGILKLSQDVQLNQYIQIACLPSFKSSYYPIPTVDSWTIGWGTVSSDSSTTSSILKNVKLTLYPASQCNAVSPFTLKNWQAQICAGDLAGGKDSCQGDSGGSLFIKDYVNGKLKYVSVGIVSYGIGCGLPNRPGIYTRVSYYLDWIERNSYTFRDKVSNVREINESAPITETGPPPTTTTKQPISLNDECGVTYSRQNLERILGGVVAEPHSWPASVYIRINYKKDIQIDTREFTETFSFACGGTLINRRTVLTAAHCIPTQVEFEYQGRNYRTPVVPNKYYPTLGSMYKVYLGFQDISAIINNELNTSPGILASVKSAYKHEQFNEFDLSNDIGLLRLTNNVELNEFVQIACLPKTKSFNYPLPVKDSWVVGWGVTSSGSISNLLRNVKITLYENRECDSVLSYLSKNWNNQLCAGEKSGGKDSCQGDSGGSLYINDTVDGKVKYVSVGIVSYGDGCGLVNKPGIYTRVSNYIDWIETYWDSESSTLSEFYLSSSDKLQTNNFYLFLFIYSYFWFFIRNF